MSEWLNIMIILMLTDSYMRVQILCYYNSITVLIILQNHKLLNRAIMLVDISDV